jgi:hypothetical protein
MARRLRIYFIGVGLGLILTWALVLRNRNADELLAWTPKNRILNELKADSNLQYPDEYTCLLKCHELTSLDIENVMNDGEINFKESSTRSEPRIYQIEWEKSSSETVFGEFEFSSDSTHTLLDFGIVGREKDCAC